MSAADSALSSAQIQDIVFLTVDDPRLARDKIQAAAGTETTARTVLEWLAAEGVWDGKLKGEDERAAAEKMRAKIGCALSLVGDAKVLPKMIGYPLRALHELYSGNEHLWLDQFRLALYLVAKEAATEEEETKLKVFHVSSLSGLDFGLIVTLLITEVPLVTASFQRRQEVFLFKRGRYAYEQGGGHAGAHLPEQTDGRRAGGPISQKSLQRRRHL